MSRKRVSGTVQAALAGLAFCIFLSAGSAHAQTPAWQPGVAYAAGALASYNGQAFGCLQARTSQLGWAPPAAPALWQPQAATPTPRTRSTATATSTASPRTTAMPRTTPTPRATAAPRATATATS